MTGTAWSRSTTSLKPSITDDEWLDGNAAFASVVEATARRQQERFKRVDSATAGSSSRWRTRGWNASEDKLIDLLPVLRNHVYHSDFRGSFSIKYVLQPLVPELSYNDLVIVDGLVASVEIARLLFGAGKIHPNERDRMRQDLLDYCERDTWAMVKLLEALRALASAQL